MQTLYRWSQYNIFESVPETSHGSSSPCRMSPERQHCPLAKLRSLRSLRPLPPSASSCQRRTRTRRAPPPARSGGGDVRYGAVCLRRHGHRQPASAGRAKHAGVSGDRVPCKEGRRLSRRLLKPGPIQKKASGFFGPKALEDGGFLLSHMVSQYHRRK